jgi:hypothetical protein
LIEEAAIQIDNPQIVIADKTTIPSLRRDKTFVFSLFSFAQMDKRERLILRI